MRKQFSNTVFFLAIFAVLLPADPPPAEAQQSQPTTWQQDGVTKCGAFIANFVGGDPLTCTNGRVNIPLGGGAGTVTSLTAGSGISMIPASPITTLGTILVDQAFSPTWTGLHTFSKATTSVTSGAASAIASGASFTGDGGAGGNTATPIFLNLSPTINLAATGGANTSGYTGILFNVTETAIGSGTKKLLDLEVGSSSQFYVTNTGNMYSPLINFGITNAGYIGLAANTSVLAAAGTGEVNLRFMTGAFRMPSGNLRWTGGAGNDADLIAGSGGAFDITGGATSSFGTTAGDLVLEPFADLRISSNIIVTTTKTLVFGGNTLVSGDKLQAPQLDGVVPLASLTGSGALAGTWSATAFGTVVANQNFTGPYRAVTNTGVFRNINCSAGTAGTTGSTDMQVQIYNVTDGAQLCGCTLGACNTGANTPLVCDCNGTFAAAKTYAVRFNNLGDCATPAQNIVCVVQMQQ